MRYILLLISDNNNNNNVGCLKKPQRLCSYVISWCHFLFENFNLDIFGMKVKAFGHLAVCLCVKGQACMSRVGGTMGIHTRHRHKIGKLPHHNTLVCFEGVLWLGEHSALRMENLLDCCQQECLPFCYTVLSP